MSNDYLPAHQAKDDSPRPNPTYSVIRRQGSQLVVRYATYKEAPIAPGTIMKLHSLQSQLSGTGIVRTIDFEQGLMLVDIYEDIPGLEITELRYATVSKSLWWHKEVEPPQVVDSSFLVEIETPEPQSPDGFQLSIRFTTPPDHQKGSIGWTLFNIDPSTEEERPVIEGNDYFHPKEARYTHLGSYLAPGKYIFRAKRFVDDFSNPGPEAYTNWTKLDGPIAIMKAGAINDPYPPLNLR